MSEALLELPETEEKTTSTHKAECFRIERLDKHSNADTLEIAHCAGFQTVVKQGTYNVGDLVTFIQPDSLVPVNHPEFSFLAKEAKEDGFARIRARKLRGVLSFGLLIPAPEGAQEGDDVAAQLGIRHYDPVIRKQSQAKGLFLGGEIASGPNVYHVKYDLESGRRYAQTVFVPGEPVWITEKIHGANARYVFHEGKMYCGSRTEWKKEYPDYSHVTVERLLATGKVDEERAISIVDNLRNKPKSKNMWWKALDDTPALRNFCEANPGVMVYGELYGAVQELRYGCKDGEIKFLAFDMMANGQWLNALAFYTLCLSYAIQHVPVLAAGSPFDFDKICEMAEGKTTVAGADHVREGVVVRPSIERTNEKIGRVCLKWVGCSYLEKSK